MSPPTKHSGAAYSNTHSHTHSNNAHTGRLAQNSLTVCAGNAASVQTPRMPSHIAVVGGAGCRFGMVGSLTRSLRLYLKSTSSTTQAGSKTEASISNVTFQTMFALLVDLQIISCCRQCVSSLWRMRGKSAALYGLWSRVRGSETLVGLVIPELH